MIMVPTFLLGIACVLIYLLCAEINKQSPHSHSVRHSINQIKKEDKYSKKGYRRVPVYPPKKSQSSAPLPTYSSDIPSAPKKSKPRNIIPDFFTPPAKPPLRRLDFTRPHPLRTKLFAMVGGDGATVDRLLNHAIRNSPGESEQWYYEKVIYDLERDRRR